jgi:hypothetical protein
MNVVSIVSVLSAVQRVTTMTTRDGRKGMFGPFIPDSRPCVSGAIVAGGTSVASRTTDTNGTVVAIGPKDARPEHA